MGKNFSEMSLSQLQAELLKYEEELEELEDERGMLLGQSGHHISGAAISEKYQILMSETKEKIAQLKELIEKQS